jgi:hypothetical protein
MSRHFFSDNKFVPYANLDAIICIGKTFIGFENGRKINRSQTIMENLTEYYKTRSNDHVYIDKDYFLNLDKISIIYQDATSGEILVEFSCCRLILILPRDRLDAVISKMKEYHNNKKNN